MTHVLATDFEPETEEIPCLPNRAHHWLIEPPSKRISVGTCKYCGSEKDFFNSIQMSAWDPPKRRQGRPSHFPVKPDAIKCRSCGETKSYTKEYFPPQAHNKWGLNYRCKACLSKDRQRRRDEAFARGMCGGCMIRKRTQGFNTCEPCRHKSRMRRYVTPAS